MSDDKQPRGQAEVTRVQELLRRLLMDYGQCDAPSTCDCSAGRAEQYLLANGVSVR